MMTRVGPVTCRGLRVRREKRHETALAGQKLALANRQQRATRIVCVLEGPVKARLEQQPPFPRTHAHMRGDVVALPRTAGIEIEGFGIEKVDAA